MEIEYGAATEADIDVIYGFSKALIDEYEDKSKIDYAEVLSWVRKKIEDHINEYSVIMFRGKKAGYFLVRENGGKTELDDLYIFPEYRNRGIGTAVLERCFNATKLPIFLYVFVKNIGAINLYSRLGFKIIEVIKDTRYIMQRD